MMMINYAYQRAVLKIAQLLTPISSVLDFLTRSRVLIRTFSAE